MVEIPTRAQLATVTAALRPALPVSALGFSQQLPDGRVAVFYSTRDGLGRHIVPLDQAPPALLPSSAGVAQIDADALAADRDQAVAWHMSFVGVSRVLAARVPDRDANAILGRARRARGAPRRPSSPVRRRGGVQR